MAEEEENQENAENVDGEEQQLEPKEENITRGQYLAIFGLFLATIYLYFVWPQFASKKSDLKDPDTYISSAQEAFLAAHGERSFPRDDRINTLKQVTWNYEASIRAGADLALADRYRWAYASYKVQSVINPRSRYALVDSMENFIECLKQVKEVVPNLNELEGQDYIEAQRSFNELEVQPEKIKFLLASAFMKVGRFEKAVPLLEDLQKLGHEFKLFQRRRDRMGIAMDTTGPVDLGASPYRLQESELEQVNLLLGQAHQNLDNSKEAILALNAYLEATRQMELAELDVNAGANMESRYEALRALADIHFGEYRKLRDEIKKQTANKMPKPEIQAKEAERDEQLQGAYQRLSQLFIPHYSVYGLEEEKIKFLEVAYRLNLDRELIQVADDFESDDPHKNNEMKLWRIKSQLRLNKNAPVVPNLNAIANDNTQDEIKLAALVTLGDYYVKRKKVDVALGELIPDNDSIIGNSSSGTYLKAALKYKEEDFDSNRFVGKLNLINATMERAHVAKENGDEQLAIDLYKFLLKYFTVPKAEIIHEIAHLKRAQAEEKKIENNDILNDEARDLYRLSADYFLQTENFSEVPYDQKARNEAYYQAAESLFDGKYYSDAYDNYAKFIEDRPDDLRVSRARHKKGVSALYIKRFQNRLEEARKDFLKNISLGLRNTESNRELSEDVMPTTNEELVAMDNILNGSPSPFYDRVIQLGPLNANADLVETLMGGNTHGIKVLEEMLNSNNFKIKVASLGNLQNNYQALRKLMGDTSRELIVLNQLLENSKQGNRDPWAYSSLYELGRTYEAEHSYVLAAKVYDRIKTDRRFTPRSEIYRLASYADAKMAYNRVSEMDRIADAPDNRPWEEAIGKLEDILRLYDLKYFDERFSTKDEKLKSEFKRGNAEIKFLLAKAYLNNGDAENAREQCIELLKNKGVEFDIAIQPDMSERVQLVTEQKTEALLADAYYELRDYGNAMEHYRRAHDRNLKSWERPFYSLSIVDCLIGLQSYDDAKNRLERTKWEFENDKVYNDDDVVLREKDGKGFTRQDWLAMVEQRRELIP